MTALAPFLLAAGALAAAPAPVRLCEGGRPLLPVTVAPSAPGRARRAAELLARDLGRVCGAPFSVRESGTGEGVALLLSPGLEAPALVEEPMRRELFALRSHARGLHLEGVTPAALEAAAAELLHRLGWRRYLPGEAWEKVPSRPDLELAVDAVSAPAFASRRVWYDFGYLDDERPLFDEWARLNRVPGAFELRTGHSFDAVKARHEDAFKAHPEWLGLVKGRRTSDKFCLSDPGLRALVREDALERLRAGGADSVSLEPTDGYGWCECAACASMGGPSDRLAVLANEVSAALEAGFPGRYAGFYAYHRHSPPPSVRLGPRVIVSVAAAYLAPGWTPESLLEAWRGKTAAPLGVREYWGVFKWHHGLPGRMRGADPTYLAKTIPRWHALGARFLSAESGGDWGAHGPGHWIAARLLWDPGESFRVDALREEFLEAMFGPAKAPMRRWYALTDGSRDLSKREVPSGLARELYARLSEAWALAPDGAVRRRLADLALYVRYVELHDTYARAGAGRREAFAALVRHARRMRDRRLVHLKGLEEWLPSRDKAAVLPPDDGAAPYTRDEAEAVLREGASR